MYTDLLEYFSAGDYNHVIKTVDEFGLTNVKNVNILNIVAAALINVGQNQQALTYLSYGLELDPRDPMLYHNFGLAYMNLQHCKLALKSILKSIQLKPQSVEANFNLAILYSKAEKHRKTITQYQRVLELKADHYEAMNNLGNVFSEIEDYISAEHYYRLSIRVKDDFADPYYNLANLKVQHFEYQEAIRLYKKAISCNKLFVKAHLNLANVLQNAGFVEEAVNTYNLILNIEKDHPQSLNNLGTLMLRLGNYKRAREYFTAAISFKPDYAEAHQNLSQVVIYNTLHPHYVQLEDLCVRPDLSEHQRCHILFAFAKAQEDVGNFKKAFELFSEANSSRKKSLNYDYIQDQNLFHALGQRQSSLAQQNIVYKSNYLSRFPIFIVGMPRSGTTLVETILSRHSSIFAGGELPIIGRLALKLLLNSEPIRENDLINFRNLYLQYISTIQTNKMFIVDKMPHNFRFLPLIASALPEAKIIHVHREPEATCWSNFKHNFNSTGLGYSCDLDDTVSYYIMYDQMMGIWKKLYKNKIIDVDYDNLVQAPEEHIRRLILNLNIPWEPGLLSNNDLEHLISTSSQLQVRQPIYRGSSMQWRKYEEYLEQKFSPLQNLSYTKATHYN
jgi:tetratricopeptide (TPR) repeat protein